jgi:short-subunit dehydrogenase
MGIGEAIAEALANEGANVALVSRSEVCQCAIYSSREADRSDMLAGQTLEYRKTVK